MCVTIAVCGVVLRRMFAVTKGDLCIHNWCCYAKILLYMKLASFLMLSYTIIVHDYMYIVCDNT